MIQLATDCILQILNSDKNYTKLRQAHKSHTPVSRYHRSLQHTFQTEEKEKKAPQTKSLLLPSLSEFYTQSTLHAV